MNKISTGPLEKGSQILVTPRGWKEHKWLYPTPATKILWKVNPGVHVCPVPVRVSGSILECSLGSSGTWLSVGKAGRVFSMDSKNDFMMHVS
jgi:hypothetical protein